MKWLQKQGPPIVLHILAVVPLALLGWDLVYGQLTADPIREIQLRTGRYAIILLVISLACTPVYLLLRVRLLLVLRRLSGLYAFAYAALHFLNFIWLDYGFNLEFLRADILEKRYVLAGLAAFLCLVPLAITSTRGWQQRLGSRWKSLHRLVYPAALFAVIHFIWQAKLDIRIPVIFTIVVIVLLIIRLPIIKRAMSKVSRKVGQ